MDAVQENKTGDALNTQRYQMLADIAGELSGEVVFPTHFDLTLRLRGVLKDPNVSLQQVTAVVAIEPLICSKLVSIANSALYHRGGAPIRDVKAAIQRLGMEVVRTTAFGIAIKQMLLSKNVADFGELTGNLWEHAVHTAAACMVIARQLTRLSADEAMLAGLVHDLGASYMLYRASQYEELRARPETMKHLIAKWHESIGESLLHALGLPEEVVAATHDHDQPRELPYPPKTLADVVYAGNLLAGGHFEWLYKDFDAAEARRAGLGEPYLALQDEIRQFTEELRTSFT